MYSVQLNVPDSVRVAVREFLTMPFSNGMRNRHVATVNWLASDGPQHGIVAWMVLPTPETTWASTSHASTPFRVDCPDTKYASISNTANSTRRIDWSWFHGV